MKRPMWNDNICNSDITCISGLFSVADMRELEAMHPQGYFTPCFISKKRHMSASDFEKHLETNSTYQDRGRFYFTFPENAAGKRLLKMLGFTESDRGKYQLTN